MGVCVMDEKTLNRYEDEALGAAHAASKMLWLGRGSNPHSLRAAVFCERYARACADRAIAENSPGWSVMYRIWHTAALDWLDIAKGCV